MPRRCLILGCSRTKNMEPELAPAVERYDGPIYRVLHKFLREAPLLARSLDIFILSAEFGLIPADKKIPVYNRRMTASRAVELHSEVMRIVEQTILPRQYSEIFVSMGKTYVRALDGLPEVVGDQGRVIISNSSSGKMLSQLKNWLWDEEPSSAESADPRPVTPNDTPKSVVLRGRSVTLTTEQAVEKIQQAILEGTKRAHSVRRWYVDVKGEKASPKWAAQLLFDVPVSEFSADEARRVLRGLGLNCYEL